MKISVITVAYNSAATIGDTLRSVAEQTHPEVEHIVIDGASTDRTLDVVRAEGRHVWQLVSEPDAGIYDAMNKGLRLATGDFVGFLNADDMFADRTVLEQLAVAMANADIVYGDLNYVDGHNSLRTVRRWRSGHFQQSRLAWGWMPPHPTFYFRLQMFRPERFDVRYRIAADYDFMLRCLSQSSPRVAYLKQVLVLMRTGGASNRSLTALWQKSKEDYWVLRKNHLSGLFGLVAKIGRKLPQVFLR